MSRSRLAAFVDALLGNRRPKGFRAKADDAEAMRAAIELGSGQPGANLPRGEFVAELHQRLREQLTESPAESTRSHVSRRALLTGAAAAAAAAAAGAVIDHQVIVSPNPPAKTRLLADHGKWTAVAKTEEIAEGRVVSFSSTGALGFISRTGGSLRAVSGVCTHQGCLLALNDAKKQLDCPCHGASFAPSGKVLHHEFPEPLSPLPQLPVREVDGRIEVYLPQEI